MKILMSPGSLAGSWSSLRSPYQGKLGKMQLKRLSTGLTGLAWQGWRALPSVEGVGPVALRAVRRQRGFKSSSISFSKAVGAGHASGASRVLSPEERREHLHNAIGKELYPASFVPSLSLEDFRQKYDTIDATGLFEGEAEVLIAGRISSKREASKKLFFLDVRSGSGERLQIMSDMKRTSLSTDSFVQLHRALRRGDIVGIRGYPGRSQKGELSLFSTEVMLLSPCLADIPERSGLKNPEVRLHQRYLDFLVNEEIKENFKIRAKTIAFVRRFLEDRGFLEVETPMLSGVAGGAVATPFATHSRALDVDLYLRIAPELYLKQLVIGGFERVFELGRVFRNEGVDATHNPEFTICEFYEAYSDYNQLMRTTEELLSSLVQHVTGGMRTEAQMKGKDGELQTVEIDWSPPYRRIHILPSIEAELGEKLPDLKDEAAAEKLLAIMDARGISCPAPHTVPRLIDRLISELLEPQCVNPTFLCDHPLALSPLAKRHRENPDVAERFELFVAGKEVCNAYTELNDPAEQRQRFLAQSRDRAAGDEEAPLPDESFCHALEYGLPPTGGFGMGIDRVVMLLTGSMHIKDVLLFPAVKAEVQR